LQDLLDAHGNATVALIFANKELNFGLPQVRETFKTGLPDFSIATVDSKNGSRGYVGLGEFNGVFRSLGYLDKDQFNCKLPLPGDSKPATNYEPAKYGLQNWRNCVPWYETTPGKHSDWCVNDFGAGWEHVDQVNGDCPQGLGKGVCVYQSNVELREKPWFSCVAWGETEAGKHNDWCANDHGQGWKHTGQINGGCTLGFGKGLCKLE
jgi:hypothetical protein